MLIDRMHSSISSKKYNVNVNINYVDVWLQNQFNSYQNNKVKTKTKLTKW